MCSERKNPLKTKFLGKVEVGQMSFHDGISKVLERISPVCENCSNNTYYNIYKNYKISYELVILPILPSKSDEIYSIKCPECGETIELANEEFDILKPIIKVNNQFSEGKISESERNYKVEEILEKLRRKRHL